MANPTLRAWIPRWRGFLPSAPDDVLIYRSRIDGAWLLDGFDADPNRLPVPSPANDPALGEFQKDFMRQLASENDGVFVDLGR